MEGAPPLHSLHPQRALAAIPRLPAPRLARPDQWSLALQDVVTECLTRDWQQRPSCKEVIKRYVVQAKRPVLDFSLLPKTFTLGLLVVCLGHST